MAAGRKPAQPGGWSARLQMYIVILGAYYAYKAWKGHDPTAASGSSGSNGKAEAQDCKDDTDDPQRKFAKVQSIWMSSLEAGACSNMQLFMVHQTALSAESEFGESIPQILAKAAPPGGLQVLALDRPCHGYSTCPEAGEPEDDSALFTGVLARRPASRQFSYVASGRTAARLVLATVVRRRMAARILLLRPHLVSVDSKAITSAAAAVDSARWSAMHGDSPSDKGRPAESLDVAKLPRGCTVTLMYLESDEEDQDLKTSLEDADHAVEVRYVDSIEDGIVPAVADMLAGDGAATAEPSDEEV